MEGVVQEIITRAWNDKTMYNIKMNDGKIYGCGSVNPEVTQGMQIAFDVQTKGQYSNVVGGTIKVLSAAPAQPAKSPVALAFNSSGNSREDYWQEKGERDIADYNGVSPRQKNIQEQSARKDALQFLSIAASIDALPIPKSKKAGEKFDLLMDLTSSVQTAFLEGLAVAFDLDEMPDEESNE